MQTLEGATSYASSFPYALCMSPSGLCASEHADLLGLIAPSAKITPPHILGKRAKTHAHMHLPVHTHAHLHTHTQTIKASDMHAHKNTPKLNSRTPCDHSHNADLLRTAKTNVLVWRQKTGGSRL